VQVGPSGSAPADFRDLDYDSPEARPRLRGWLHLGAFLASILTGAVLIPLSWAHSAAAGPAVTIYCLTVSAMFGVSAAYHRRAWSPRGWKVMKILDHSTIFLFIAGSYTPFSVLALEGTFRWVILGVVWGGGLAGIALKTSWPTAPRWMGVPIYLALGWVAVLFFPAILTNLGITTLVLISAGGGAVLTRRDRLRDVATKPVAGRLRVPRGVSRRDHRGCGLPLHRGLLRDVCQLSQTTDSRGARRTSLSSPGVQTGCCRPDP